MYSTTAPLAMFMLWLSMFRGDLFEASQPVVFYLEGVVNSSLSDSVLLEGMDIVKMLTATDPFEALFLALEETVGRQNDD